MIDDQGGLLDNKMKLTFVGTGEAFDPYRNNASYLIEDENSGSIMIDCGYTAPSSLCRLLEGQKRNLSEVPDSLLITHFHGDHFAGVPALLMPCWEETVGTAKGKVAERRKIEVVSAHPDIRERVERVMQDYPGFLETFKEQGPEIAYRSLCQGEAIQGFKVTFAPTTHGVHNFAYRLEKDGKSFAISGDGDFTTESRDLFNGVGLLIHEGFLIDKESKNHASIKDVIDYAIAQKIPRVKIVHVHRQERRNERRIQYHVGRALEQGVEVSLPNDHDQIIVNFAKVF